MSRATFALGIAVLLGMVALIAWYTLRETEDPPPEAAQARSVRTNPRPVEEIVEFAPDRPRVPREPEVVAPPRPAPGEKPATITGRVLGPDGEPMTADLYVSGPHPGRFGRTVEGRISISVPAGTWNLEVLANNLLNRTIEGVVCRAGETKDLGDLKLERGSSISGRVLTTEGAPVVGARVTAFDWPPEPVPITRASVVTGVNGEFTLWGFSEFPVYLRAARVDIRVESKPEEVRPGSTGIVIVVRKLRVLAGQVVSENDGRPVLGATVNLEVQAPRWGVSFKYRTLEDGRFAFDLSDDRYSDPELRAIAFRVSATGFEDLDRNDVTMESLDPEAGFKVSLFPAVIEEPGTLKGRVVYDTGAPFRGELTLSFSREGKAGQIHRVATDEDGRFELPGVPPGEYSLRTATGSSQVLADTGRRLVIVPGGEESVEFTVKRGGDVDLRVFDSDGQPLTGATVAWGEHSAVTQHPGRLWLSDQTPGPMTLVVTAPGHRPKTVDVVAVRDQAVPVEVRLRAE